jgi:serine-type D-Ala-D-Ala carboxypeptidase (penicillin-binding protein 5/6)
MRFWKNPSLYFLILLILSFVQIPGYSYYRFLKIESRQPSYRELPNWLPDIEVKDYPVKVGTEELPELTAEGVIAVDVDSAVPIYQKNSELEFYPASTTKIMTALIAIDEYDLDDLVEVPSTTYSGSVMRLLPGERISVKNLLYGLLINSGNDAAEVLAEYYPTGKSGFISRMNKKATEIGLRHTHFENPSGLPHVNHKMSAWDLGYLAAYGLRNRLFSQIVSTKKTVVYGTNGERHTLKTTNKLLGEVWGLDGVKTGYTDEAGEVLVSSVERNGRRVVFVVLKSADRFGETKNLIEWVFRNFEWRKF